LSANYEPQDLGWDPAWNDRLPSGAAGNDWKDFFDRCDPSAWHEAGEAEQERRPVRCVTWFVAMAFCIWDGGYLPSAAELSYAAMGGTEQATYPWGDAPPIDPQHAVYGPWSETATQSVGSLPAGNGRWGQSDLVGNVWEWCSYNAREAGDCEECTCNSFNSDFVNGRSFGGSYEATAEEANALSFQRVPLAQGVYLRDRGIRCARAP
jgi:formylglycine-generating enzyme required for sulfatase activity